MLLLSDVLAGTHGTLEWMNLERQVTLPDMSNAAFSGVTVDSRTVTPGSIFVARRGTKLDGHDFIPDAVARGARCVIMERDLSYAPTTPSAHQIVALIRVDDPTAALQLLANYWRDKVDPIVVGITGSVGKTSTKEVTAAVLRQKYKVHRSEGNYNSETGLPMTLLNLEPGDQVSVLEMGGGGRLGEIAELARIARPQLGIVTIVAESHLETMGTIERIAEMKSELPQALPPTGWAVLNGDDARVRAMANVTAARAFFYGLDPSNHLWAEEIEGRGLEGIAFVLCYDAGKLADARQVNPELDKSQRLHLRLPLLGEHSVHTALAAASVGLLLGLDWSQVAAGLADAGTEGSGAQVRIIAAPGINGSTIIDDSYNASPTSVLAALNLLEQLQGPKVAVLGDMLELGPYEEAGHRKVGVRVATVANRLVAVGPMAQLIGQEAIASGMPAQNVHYAPDNDNAVAWLKQNLQAGDNVLVKGSHARHMEEIVQKVRA
ncbi:MAG: UDP-N-acetylmuramoylalanyl-D-glutamyl-2, 6-diaminopimelate--D-alanyl-D-alanine ligase [Candidatus Chloroheliales bacterium]|nr:MAG: UDP-N-acetylmuramoylalanyl-D-glutamyl-2, 6-diaminopimelate--D-alanyl-D-alanine ligase [Chloroflexota bacterium]